MKHIVFFLSVVVSGVIIAGGAYVYSSGSGLNSEGGGHRIAPNWFEEMLPSGPEFSAAVEEAKRQAATLKVFTSQGSRLSPGDLFPDVGGGYFYPKLYSRNHTEDSTSDDYSGDIYGDTPAFGEHQDRIGPQVRQASVAHSEESFWPRGALRVGHEGQGGFSGAGHRAGAGDSPEINRPESNEAEPVEMVPDIAESLPSLGELYDLDPFIQEEGSDDEVFADDLIGEKPDDYRDDSSQPVPEPGTLLLLGLGFFALLFGRRWVT